MKKILMVSEWFYPFIGGAGEQAKQLSSKLEDSFNFEIITRRVQPEWLREEIVNGVLVKRLGPSGQNKFADYFCAFNLFIYILKNRKKIDLIHIHGSLENNWAFAAILAGKITGKMTLAKMAVLGEFTMHREWLWNATKFNLRDLNILLLIRRFIAKKADYYVAISGAIKEELLRSGINQARTFEVPNGVDAKYKFTPPRTNEKNEYREKLGFSNKATILIFVGRMIKHKGVELLLEVFKDLSEKHKDVLLLLLGSGKFHFESVEEKVREYIKNNKLESNVYFMGDKTNVSEYLKIADIMVLPSLNEGLSNVVLEAMATGLPVCVSSIPGLDDLVNSGEDGVLFKAGNFSKLEEALEKLIKDEKLRKSLGEKARKKILDKYDFSKISHSYKLIYNSLLAD